MTTDKSAQKVFRSGVTKMAPVAVGVIPFGLIMGTVASNAQLNFVETFSLNFLVYAGASQLVVVDLMGKGTPLLITVLTGLVINLRLTMYSLSLAPLMGKEHWLKKIGLAYMITDQSYAVSLNEFEQLTNPKQKIFFYMGASALMILTWQVSTFFGFLFGNFAPDSLSLDFAIPLAFASIIIPSLVTRPKILVAVVSGAMSLVFYELPFNLGIMAAAICALTAGLAFNRLMSRGQRNDG